MYFPFEGTLTMRGRLAFALALLVIATAVVWGLFKNKLSSAPELVWGQLGQMPGSIARPRAVVIDPQDRLYLVDFTARIQSYSLDGVHTGVTFTTPDYRNGRPSGLGIDRDGNLLVADSHYHCVRTYSADGTLLKTFGNASLFGYVSDCLQDKDGNYFVSEFGTKDRITKLDVNGNVLKTWGESGGEPGQFQRVRALAFGPDGHVYVADSCNHRIQVFTPEGVLVRVQGGPGQGNGEFSYPFDISFDSQGNYYVVERGNARVQKFNKDGGWVGSWGSPGSKPGQLADPWALVVDKNDRVHVVDTENHRVQRVKIP